MKPSDAPTPTTLASSHYRLLLSATLLGTCALQPALAANAVGLDVMQGFPPAVEMRVNKTNAFLPPYLRWSMRHAREVSATRHIAGACSGRSACFSAGDFIADGRPMMTPH